jgi:hypothetical protein
MIGIPGDPDPHPHWPNAFSNLPQFVYNILYNDLTPVLHIVISVSFFIGLCMIIGGITRLHRHAQGQQTMFRVAPMGTAMYFVAGTVLISFMPELQMLSTSFFSPNSVLMQQCAGQPSGQQFYTSSNNFCPMEAYATDIMSAPPGDAVKEAIKYLAFGALMLVGIISFIRGMIQLVHIGEGQGGQGAVGKAFAHIVGGLVAVNADNFYALMESILTSASSSPS